ncbi:MAG: hypothetical protein V2J24_11215 [Pseudomonadales bacterium]|jgi:hypothetical protein|nr:hypothetical protein [Pseudomonadales bacterium]
MSDEKITRLHDDSLSADAAARLDARLGALPLELEPPAGTFDAIAARLPQRRGSDALGGRRGGNWGGFALAASIAACAVFLVLELAGPTDAPAPAVARKPAPGAAIAGPSVLEAHDRYRTASLPRALGGRAALGAGFLQVRQELSTDFASKLEALDPATRDVVETNLKVIHGALTRIESALAGNPEDAVLQDLLMSTYRQELDYLGRVGRMPAGPERSMEL